MDEAVLRRERPRQDALGWGAQADVAGKGAQRSRCTPGDGGSVGRLRLVPGLRQRSRRRIQGTEGLEADPTRRRGLHFADIEKLIDVLHRLVDRGNTVVTIEHNLDIIKEADWLIDLGPEGGAGGGEVVAMGPPTKVAKAKRSHTAKFLRAFLRA